MNNNPINDQSQPLTIDILTNEQQQMLLERQQALCVAAAQTINFANINIDASAFRKFKLKNCFLVVNWVSIIKEKVVIEEGN